MYINQTSMARIKDLLRIIISRKDQKHHVLERRNRKKLSSAYFFCLCAVDCDNCLQHLF